MKQTQGRKIVFKNKFQFEDKKILGIILSDIKTQVNKGKSRYIFGEGYMSRIIIRKGTFNTLVECFTTVGKNKYLFYGIADTEKINLNVKEIEQ